VGYRSTVAYAVKFSLLPDDLLKEFIQYADDIHMKTHDGEAYVMFYITSIKWYENEEGFLAYKLSKLEISDVDYRVIVIGEDKEDMRDDGELDVFSMGIARDINYEGGKEYDNNKDYDNIKADMLPKSEEAVFNKIRKLQNELRSNQEQPDGS